MGPHRKKRQRLKPFFWIIAIGLLSIIVSLNIRLLNGPAEGPSSKPGETERKYEKFDRDIAENRYTLVMFKSDNCNACRKIQADFVTLKTKITDPDLKILSVTKNEMPELSKRYKIPSFPSFILFKSKDVLRTWVGSDKLKDVEDFLKSDWKRAAQTGGISNFERPEFDTSDEEEDEEEENAHPSEENTTKVTAMKPTTKDVEQSKIIETTKPLPPVASGTKPVPPKATTMDIKIESEKSPAKSSQPIAQMDTPQDLEEELDLDEEDGE